MKRFVLYLLMIAHSMICVAADLGKNQHVLLPVKNDPTTSFRIWFKVGSQNDPAGKEGLASLTASMLTDASTTNNAYEVILDKLYPLATGYSSLCSEEMTVIAGRTHRDNLKEYYPLLMDAILRPAFAQKDLDRIKAKVLNYLQNTLRYASDEELGKAVLYSKVYAGTGYGHITPGTVEALKSITLDDIRAFYRQYYTAGNVVIGVGGGYEEALVAALDKDLHQLPAGAPSPVAKPVTAPLKGFHVTIVEKDAASTAISMGYPIQINRGTKEWYALALANSWLGEHRNSSSHLYQVIREARGLNYGDYSYIERFPDGGSRSLPPQNVALRQQMFEIWIRPVPNENRLFALRAALREYKKLTEHGMTQEEFELTKKFLSKYVLHYAERTDERLAYAVDDRFYGIKGSHLELFRKYLKDITLSDVNNAIKKHWRYGDMQVAIVTKDAKSLKESLVAGSPSPIEYKSPKPDSVLAEDKEIAVFPVPVKAEHVSIVPVSELFEK